MVETIRLQYCYNDIWADALEGKYLNESHIDRLIGEEDADVYKPDGTLLLAFRRNVLPEDLCRRAYPALWQAATPSSNRGAAAGGRSFPLKLDGTRSRTIQSKPVLSGIVGFFDRTARQPFCRTTAYTARESRGWASVVRFAQAANEVFRNETPDRYEAQMKAVRRTPPEYIIHKTAFTTITVNRNWQTAVHKDEGDLAAGFGVMSVIDEGRYGGGYLVFPKYGVAVNMRRGCVLLADVHEWHGNTPLIGTPGEYERISTVLYFRENMPRCLPSEAELERAKRRRPGDPL